VVKVDPASGTSGNQGCAALGFIYYPKQQGGLGMMLGKWLKIAVFGAKSLVGCATASPVMDAGDGVYLISARAAPARGGATGAQTVAYQDAQKFCAQKGDALHPIVVDTQEREIYQSSVGGGFNKSGGGFGGSTMASGAVSFRFRCGQ
jgi:hypothetical protein